MLSVFTFFFNVFVKNKNNKKKMLKNKRNKSLRKIQSTTLKQTTTNNPFDFSFCLLILKNEYNGREDKLQFILWISV